jgi:hypothetical protein
MKYIMIQDSDGLEFPVFGVAPLTHAQLAAAFRPDDSRRVVSAGFVEFLPTGAALVFGHSESLGLGPRPGRDAALITAMHFGTVRMARALESREPGSAHAHARGLRDISPTLRDEIAREVAQLHPPAAPHRAAV